MVNEALVIAAMPEAKAIALGMAHKTHFQIDRDELIGIAYAALVEAGIRYDGKRPFPVFARCRVRGAILDALRAWSQVTGTRQRQTRIFQIQDDSGAFLVEPFAVSDSTRDMRALSRAVATLGAVSAARIRRFATAVTDQGSSLSEPIHVEFGQTRMNWQYHRKAILAKLRFALAAEGITKVSDCL